MVILACKLPVLAPTPRLFAQRSLNLKTLNFDSDDGTYGASYSSSLVTLENSPLLSLVSQKMGFVSLKPCLTHPSSLTW